MVIVQKKTYNYSIRVIQAFQNLLFSIKMTYMLVHFVVNLDYLELK